MAGTTLQGNKYVIHARSAQTDFGATYQATHIPLGQPVVLQTLNDVLRQRSDFDQIRQQFMLQVRSLAEQPTIQLLDCFEENGLPFAVLQLAPGQAPPKLSDWFSLQPEAKSSSDASNATKQPLAASPDFSSNGHSSTAELPSINPDNDTLAAVTHSELLAATAQLTPQAIPPVNGTSVNGAAGAPVQPPPAQPEPQSQAQPPALGLDSSRPKRHRFPLAIAMVSLIGACVGIGMGLALRFEPRAQPQQASGLRPGGLFSREQAFPPQQEWPVAEPPEYYAPDTAEEPIYRTNSSDYLSNPAANDQPDASVRSPDYTAPAAPAPAEKTASTPTPAAPSPKSTAPWASDIPPLAPIAPASPAAATAPIPNRASSVPAPLSTPVAPDLPAPLAPSPLAPAAPAIDPAPSLTPKRMQMDDPAVVNQ